MSSGVRGTYIAAASAVIIKPAGINKMPAMPIHDASDHRPEESPAHHIPA